MFFSPFSDDQTDANTLPAPEAKLVPTADPPPPSPKEKHPEVLEILGKKYIIVHTEEGTKVLPVPESVESPPKVIVAEVHSGLKKPDVPVIAISAPPPTPALPAAPAESVKPPTTPSTLSANETDIAGSTPVISATPTKTTETKAKDTVSVTEVESHDTLVSIMLGNKSYLCKMVTEMMGVFYQENQPEAILFPDIPSRNQCYITPKTYVLPINMPDIDVFCEMKRSSTAVRPKT